MDWIRENKTCATIIGVFAAGALALAVWFYFGWSAYGQSQEDLSNMSRKVSKLESAPLYPNEEHLTKLEEMVNDYAGTAGELSSQLIEGQKQADTAALPPGKPTNDTEFQARLKERIAATKEKFGADRLPKNFAFGFELYTISLPRPEAAESLHHYFSAVDAVVTAALESGVTRIDSVTRSDLMVEKGEQALKAEQEKAAARAKSASRSSSSKSKTTKSKAAAPKKSARPIVQVVERRSLTMQFTADQLALQLLMNALASKDKVPFFSAVRVLRIENEKQEGPIRGAPPPEKLQGSKGSNEPAHDAYMVLGGEKLHVHLEIDLARFTEPAPDPSDSAK